MFLIHNHVCKCTSNNSNSGNYLIRQYLYVLKNMMNNNICLNSKTHLVVSLKLIPLNSTREKETENKNIKLNLSRTIGGTII